MNNTLKDFQFAIKISNENESELEKLGYERRCGSCTYKHNYFVIVPLKLWYYPVESYYGIIVDTEDEVVTKSKLKVSTPK